MKKSLLLLLMALSLNACHLDTLGLVYSRSGNVETRFAQSMEYNARTGYAACMPQRIHFSSMIQTLFSVMKGGSRQAAPAAGFISVLFLKT